jgi:hypothetical protein
MSQNNSSGNGGSVIYVLIGIFTAVVGYHINDQSLFWAIVDWLFWPFAWVKWLICQEVSISVIKEAFAFFLQ